MTMPPPSYNPMQPSEHPDAQKALIASIVALLCCWPVGIWSLLTSKKIKDEATMSGAEVDGKANAAFIVSIIAIALGAVGIIFALFSFVLGGAM